MQDPYDFAAEHLLSSKIDAIRPFWVAFERDADELDKIFESRTAQPDRVSEIMEPLNSVDPDLMWEFGPSEKGHSICITAEFRNNLRALARAVVNMAPPLDRFEVRDHRTGNGTGNWEQNFAARFRIPITLSSIETGVGNDNKIAMVGIGPSDDGKTGDEVLSLATYFLGEQIDRDWFGAVDTQRQQKKGLSILSLGKRDTAFSPEMFLEKFHTSMAEAKRQRPAQPHHEMDHSEGERILFKVETPRPDIGRPDLMTFTARSAAYVNAAIGSTRFSSVNHSSFGEWFLFVSIPQTPAFGSLDDRSDLEDMLHEALSSQGLGGVAATSMGRDTMYIDLAVTDILRSLGLIAEALRNVPTFGDTHVHFLEAGLAQHGHPLSDFLVRHN